MKSKQNIARSKAGLARFFSSSLIKEFATKGASKLAYKLLQETDSLNLLNNSTLADFYDSLYELLFKEYRCEYFYKNAIAQKIVLGKHSLNTSFMMTEFRADDCKADAVVFNGTSTVYEIKSAYDSTERLQRQIAAYRKLFDNINVITTEKMLAKVSKEIAEDIGILALTDRKTISVIREPQSLKEAVDPEAIFNSLQRNEYLKIIKEVFGEVIDVPNTLIYRTSKDIFSRLSPIEAHDAMVKVLKERGSTKRLHEFINAVPNSLKAVSLGTKLNLSQQKRFLSLLNVDLEKCLIT